MRILVSIAFLLIVNICLGQYPTTQNLGNTPQTLVNSNAIKSKFINSGIFADTTAANADPYIKFYNGATILTYTGGVKTWARYDNTWVLQTGSGGGSMVYPAAGIALSTGSAWGSSIASSTANQLLRRNAANTGYEFFTPTYILPSDTAAMLGGYVRSTRFLDSLTAHWSAIQGKVNISDTGTMLSPYLRKIDTANIRPRLYAGSNVTITGTYHNLTIASSGGGGGSI